MQKCESLRHEESVRSLTAGEEEARRLRVSTVAAVEEAGLREWVEVGTGQASSFRELGRLCGAQLARSALA